MANYGYIRVSTQHQHEDRQLATIIQAYPELANHQERIFVDHFTGRSFDRPNWNRLCSIINRHDQTIEKDNIVFDEVNRMGRTAEEGFALYKEFFNSGVDLEFLHQQHISTKSYKEAMQGLITITVDTGDEATDKLISGIMDNVNEFILRKIEQDIYRAFENAEDEVVFQCRRIKEGIQAKKDRGEPVGRRPGAIIISKKSVAAKEKILKYNKNFGGPLTNEDTWKFVGISKNTFYKYLQEIKEDLVMDIP